VIIFFTRAYPHFRISDVIDRQPPPPPLDVPAPVIRLLVAVALGTDDVVVVNEESFADETYITGVARETAGVPVTAFKRHVTGAFRSQTCGHTHARN